MNGPYDSSDEPGARTYGSMPTTPAIGPHRGRELEPTWPPSRGDSDVGQVFGSYRLLDVLGKGGMGVVYLAEHVRLERRVALKMLNPECASNPMSVRRFFSEARAVNTISHENIVQVTDFIDTDTRKCFIMELLEGETLQALIKSDGLLYFDRIIKLLLQVCSALGSAHEAGIVHRDLKPGNIFVTHRGRQPDFVKVLDFGIAKLIDLPTGNSLHRTAAGTLLGTPEYMSPEQASGRLETDHRTDIYSLGVIMYEMIARQRPFEGKSVAEILVKQTCDEPKPLRDIAGLPYIVPPRLEALIQKCLAKNPNRRPQSMQEVAIELRAIEKELPATVPTARVRVRANEGSEADDALPDGEQLERMARNRGPLEPSDGVRRPRGVVANLSAALVVTVVGFFSGVAVDKVVNARPLTGMAPASLTGRAVAPPQDAPSAAPQRSPSDTAAPAPPAAPSVDTQAAEPRARRTSKAVKSAPRARKRGATRVDKRRARSRRKARADTPSAASRGRSAEASAGAKPAPEEPVRGVEGQAPAASPTLDPSAPSPATERPAAGEAAGRIQVTFHSMPEGAEVFIDGEHIGTTPLRRTFRPREHALPLEFRMTGRQSVRREVKMDADREVWVQMPEPVVVAAEVEAPAQPTDSSSTSQ